ncbi:MAG TPA: family 78 glycoside hydrolase catalytic domain [Bacteroidales bacterium]|nr:family 78 glycoside hydrolase catalytic domain [Bacteroidales bacterium]
MMKYLYPFLIILFLLLADCSNVNKSCLKIDQIKCNGVENPIGTDRIPEFNWILTSEKRGQEQTAYQIVVSSNKKTSLKGKGDLWDSEKKLSPNNAWIKYDGKDLIPGKEYFWSVRAWDNQDKPSGWGSPGSFITGLFEPSDWSGAKWIGYEDIPDSLLIVPGVHGNGDNLRNIAVKRTVIPCFRKDFSPSKKIKKAYVFISGLGHYELYINGNKTGDRFLSPGWTDYRKTCLYNTYDVTEYLTDGQNTISTIVGNGFYNINRERYRKLVISYGAPKMILKLLICYDDGSSESVISDETWKTSPSPITFSSIYGGEDYDARMEQDGWNEPGFDDHSWKSVIISREPSADLRPERDYPVKVMERISPESVTPKKDSLYIYDFGQNASGIIRLAVQGKKGEKIILRPGELLDEDSLVTQQATGKPYIFSYILKGENEEVWIPKFTYYGFRYLQAEGAVPFGATNPGKPVIKEIEMLHTRNSSPEDGSFECSNELFNKIYELINWAIRSNLSSVVTDCPHREKLGWLEQTHLMGNSIRYIYDIHNLYDKVIDDMIEAQLENGLVPDIAPEYVPFVAGFRDSPEWGSACVILPWYMYEWYGDIDVLKKAYPMAKRYVDYLSGMAEYNILSHGLGDWYDLGPQFPGEAQLTPKKLTATSIYYHDITLLAKMAELNGGKKDADFYKNLGKQVRNAFNNEFLNPTEKVYSTGSQTAYSMPLYFGMVDDSIKNKVVGNLVRSINENNKELTAGDIGYRYLLRVLEQEGHSQLIFDMNSKNDVPGYGFQLAKGATALTESWAALKYVSNNHLMLGHIMEWFYSGVAGIRQDTGSAGYKNIRIAPEFIGDITHANACINTIHGMIRSSWVIKDDTLTMKISIPVSCKAIVEIPQSDPSKISESDIQITGSKDIKILKDKGDKTICEIASGNYIFISPFSKQ